VTKSHRDREHVRPLPRRHAIEMAHQLGEEIVWRADDCGGSGTARAVTVGVSACGMCPLAEGQGSVDRGEEATGGAIEDVTPVLPGRALTESC